MRLAGIAEGYSNHPLARAVLAFTAHRFERGSGYTETPGMALGCMRVNRKSSAARRR
jgi:cation transport ATPase